MIRSLALCLSLVSCQHAYQPPCTLTHTQTLQDGFADSLVRTPDGHLRAQWAELGTSALLWHAAEWDATGVLLKARQASVATASDDNLAALPNASLVFTGDALWEISPANAEAPGAQTVTAQSLDPAGAAIPIFSCAACALRLQAEAVNGRVFVAVQAGSGGTIDPVLFYSLDATGKLANRGVLPVDSILLQSNDGALLSADAANGWSVFDESGTLIVGPIPGFADTFAWNATAQRAALGWTASRYGGYQSFVARTDASGAGYSLHVSTGATTAVSVGASLTAIVFVDDGIYFAAMRANGEKLGGDVLLAGSDAALSFATAVIGESTPGTFSIAYSSGGVIALAQVVCQP